MNGKDGKPFKTRAGGVMRLSDLIREINEEMSQKIAENRTVAPEEAEKTAQMVGLAALKYGDLSNQASKDYVFDLDKFSSFEGNTGPYILYTIVRIKSILNKYAENGGNLDTCSVKAPHSDSERALMLWIRHMKSLLLIRSAVTFTIWQTASTVSTMITESLAKRMKKRSRDISHCLIW